MIIIKKKLNFHEPPFGGVSISVGDNKHCRFCIISPFTSFKPHVFGSVNHAREKKIIKTILN